MSEDPAIYGSDRAHERTIGERIKRYRLDRNLSQEALAEKAGVARRTITSVENGQGCTINTLLRLLRALDRLELLRPLLAEPPLSPQRIHEANLLRKPPRKHASRPRKVEEPKPWVWGDEK